MLALFGGPFDYVHVNLRGGKREQSGYVAKQRYGQVPLVMDHANGRHLCQSAAILEYLSDVTGRFGGATLEERIRAREWMDWDFIRLRGPDPLLARLQAQPSQRWPRRRHMDAAEARAALQVLEHHLVGGT